MKQFKPLESMIFAIRDRKVIIDADYFPCDFAFRLTAKERLEVVTNCDHLARLKLSPTLPMAFTEHGAIMAANTAILKRVAEIDRTLLQHDTALLGPYEKLLPLLQPPEDPPKHRISFQSKGEAYRIQ
ncbi:MAG: hypothetical protein WBK08_02160 [Nitrospira sp.]